MVYARRSVSPPLSHAVDHLWGFEDHEVGVLRGFLFADGCTDLMFLLDGPLHAVGPGERQRWRGGIVSGQRTGPLGVELESHRFTIVGARLRPTGLPALVGAPARETAERTVELREFWSRDAEDLAEAMADARDLGERLELLEAGLARRLRLDRRVSPALEEAIERLRLRPTDRSIAQLADDAGLGPRQLLRLFHRHVGLRPKAFQCVSRFRRMIREAQRLGGHRGWAARAVEAGYADQAHLCREVRAFTGFTPSELGSLPPGAPDYLPWAPTFLASADPPSTNLDL